MPMIDWLDFRFPAHSAAGFETGRKLGLMADGSISYDFASREAVQGSFSETVSVLPVELKKPVSDDRATLARVMPGAIATLKPVHLDTDFYTGAGFEISGSPLKFLQGHNCFGDSDIRAFALAMARQCDSIASLGLWPEDLDALASGRFRVTRVDLTEMIGMQSAAIVNAVIRGMESGVSIRRRGHGQVYKGGESVLFGAGSRRWSLTMYAKALEMVKHRPKGLDAFEFDRLLDFVKAALRIEVRLHGLELARKGLDFGFRWNEETACALFSEYFSTVRVAGEVHMPDDILQSLSPAVQGVYSRWKLGEDLRSGLSRSAFYRYRAALLAHGIDISLVQSRAAAPNVVPLKDIFKAVPLGVPEWAKGTHLYFDTSQLKKLA